MRRYDRVCHYVSPGSRRISECTRPEAAAVSSWRGMKRREESKAALPSLPGCLQACLVGVHSSQEVATEVARARISRHSKPAPAAPTMRIHMLAAAPDSQSKQTGRDSTFDLQAPEPPTRDDAHPPAYHHSDSGLELHRTTLSHSAGSRQARLRAPTTSRLPGRRPCKLRCAPLRPPATSTTPLRQSHSRPSHRETTSSSNRQHQSPSRASPYPACYNRARPLSAPQPSTSAVAQPQIWTPQCRPPRGLPSPGSPHFARSSATSTLPRFQKTSSRMTSISRGFRPKLPCTKRRSK